MDTDSDAEETLWHRALIGDGDAFGSIFDLHRDRVFRHCYHHLRTRHEAEDASAIAFLELWRKRQSVKVLDGSILPWLLVTATNTSRNISRAGRRYQQLLQRLPRVESSVSPDEQPSESTVSEELADAIRVLSIRDAQFFCLVALEGYSVSEVAEILGSSPGAARTRLHRIRRKLQNQLGYPGADSHQLRETP